MTLLVRGARLDARPVDVLIAKGRIVRVAEAIAEDADEILAAEGCLLSPAFLDLQLNGAFGHDLATEPESVWAIAERLPAHGVGAFLPTLISGPPETTRRMIAVLEAGPPEGHRGASPIGLHLEGPCLAAARRGAHEERFLRAPAERPATMLFDRVTMVTLAPELEGALELIEELADLEIAVAAGHSNAAPAELAAAKEAGLRAGTHLFNAMSGLHHREPGLAAALLDDPDLYCGIIADGVHVDPLMLRLALTAKGAARLFLVSDAMAAAGCAPGRHRLAGQEVLVDENAVRLPDGRLAGSSALLDRCLRTMRLATGRPLAELLPLVTTTPAALVGLDLAIRPGAAADLVLLDEDGGVRATILGGAVVHRT